MEGPAISRVGRWTCEEVGQWLKSIGFAKYRDLFSKEHQIDGSILVSLSESDLRQPPLQLKVLGDIKRLVVRIEELRHPSTSSIVKKSYSLGTQLDFRDRKVQFSYENADSDEQDPNYECDYVSKDIPPEIWKTALSFVYLFTVFLITAFMMVVVHDRVPEMDKYPPLPDLFLDNMPYVPWAFEVCEMVGVVLCLIWCTILVFHKHRFIIMRRMFSLMGTIFLLRCVTMLITSLSVPGKHLTCSGKTYGTLYAKIQRTLEIWRGLGMSLQGVRTCGDYMFSGHTSIITQLNFFITEYTPRKFYYLHIVSWCLNFFGIFFLLAAHEHYSIDVFMAFYLNSRLFMYYHTLANNRALMQQDANRTRVWFPLFSFFESKCHGRVPNEFESPFVGISNCILKLKNLFEKNSRISNSSCKNSSTSLRKSKRKGT